MFLVQADLTSGPDETLASLFLPHRFFDCEQLFYGKATKKGPCRTIDDERFKVPKAIPTHNVVSRVFLATFIYIYKHYITINDVVPTVGKGLV